jgi:hypothetical protein
MRALSWLIAVLVLAACSKRETPPPSQQYKPPAQAKWGKLGETDEAGVYVDHASIQEKDQLRRLWMLRDFKKKSPDGEMSSLSFLEYDCAKNRYRTLWMSVHSEPMAGGRILYSGTIPGEWSATDLYKFSCAT